MAKLKIYCADGFQLSLFESEDKGSLRSAIDLNMRFNGCITTLYKIPRIELLEKVLSNQDFGLYIEDNNSNKFDLFAFISLAKQMGFEEFELYRLWSIRSNEDKSKATLIFKCISDYSINDEEIDMKDEIISESDEIKKALTSFDDYTKPFFYIGG